MLPTLLTDTVSLDLERSVHYALMWGLEGVELRTVGGLGDRVPNVNEARLRRQLTEADLPIAAVVPGLFEGSADDRALWLNELAAFDETLAFCTRIGCRRIVASAFRDGPGEMAVEALRKAAGMAERRGVTIGVLNESGLARRTGAALAELLAKVDRTCIKAAWDPAAALEAGESPADGLEALGGQVAHVRCVDVARDADEWKVAVFGEGEVGWAHHLKQLVEQGYEGALSLEVHVEPRPKTGLHDAARLIRMMREANANSGSLR